MARGIKVSAEVLRKIVAEWKAGHRRADIAARHKVSVAWLSIAMAAKGLTRTKGQQPSLSIAQRKRIDARLAAGASKSKLSQTYGVSKAFLYRRQKDLTGKAQEVSINRLRQEVRKLKRQSNTGDKT